MSDEEQQALSDEKKQEIVNSLDAETFDLDRFLANQWEWPTFKCTVYLDGERAGKITELDEQIGEAEQKVSGLQSKNKQQTSGSLAGGGKSQEVREAEAYVDTLKNERKQLVAEFRKSALTVVFQQQKDSREVVRVATEKTKEKFSDLSDKERENDEDANEYHGHWLMQQLIRDIYDHQDRRFQGEITFDRVESLTARLVASERTKLRNNLFQALSGGNVMKQAADAGFPG